MRNLLLLVLLFTTNFSVYAAVQEDSFSYQGELLVSGQPASGNYDINVQLYSVPTGGSLITSINIASVAVDNGIFTIQVDFGDMHFVGDQRWLGLEVRPAGGSSYTPLLPRQLIANSPYSIQAQYVGTGGVDSFAIKNASVTTTKIADGAVTNSKLASSSVNSDNIINGTVTTNDIADGSLLASDIDNTSIQQRVSGMCVAGSSIREIMPDGSVTCEVDDSAGSGWGINGNLGTTPGTNFIGTTDDVPLELRVNNTQAIKITSGSGLVAATHNVLIGNNTNNITTDVSSSTILNGTNNLIKSTSSLQVPRNSIIIGGRNNTIDGGKESIIIGGSGNEVRDSFGSVIAGGTDNNIYDGVEDSFIAAGSENSIDASYSFVGGYKGAVRDLSNQFVDNQHTGTFIWSYTGMNSHAENQFLVEANGGFGIGTDAPESQLHIKGQGTTFGTLLDEVVLAVEPQLTDNDVSIVINKLDATKESALVFTLDKAPEFDIRSVNGGSLDFNNYSSGNANFMMRIHDAATNRIDFNTSLEPQVTNSLDFGSTSFRWRHIYTENITTRTGIVTDSDKRLKDDIVDLDYGLAEVLTLRPVSYHLKQDDSKQTHLGFIAQEVESIVPEIVRQTSDKKHMRSMSYSELIPVLIKATQEQQSLIDQQSVQIQHLQDLVINLIQEK